MDKLTKLWKLVCLAFFVVADAQKAIQEIDVCDAMVNVRGRLLHLFNPDFPGYPLSRKQCNCTVHSVRGIPVKVYVRILVTSSEESFAVKYNESGELMMWTGFADNITSRDNNKDGLLITGSATIIELGYKYTNTMKSIFALDIEANGTDELRISCEQHPFTSSDDKDTKQGDVIAYIDSLCSPFMVIALGSVSTVFLVLTIALSVILCCTLRKGQKVRFRKPSETAMPLSNQSSLGLPMESYRVASRIYDDGMAQRMSRNGNQDYPAPRHHSVPSIRNSAGYANTLDMNIYGNT